MRIDDGDLYVLPTLEACCLQCRCHPQDGRTATSIDDDTHPNDEPSAKTPFVFSQEDAASFLTLKLEQLPLLTEEGDQTPIGARGWYASAVLSAMLLCGHETLHRDIFPECRQLGEKAERPSTAMMIELGSGVVGLVGMTLAWILAQQSCGPTTKIVMTDYDGDVLRQLERNVKETQRRLFEYFGQDAVSKVPQLEAAHLDWNEYDRDQPLLLQTVSADEEDDDKDSQDEERYPVTFVCGAALVYTEETEACADQVAKILQMHPQAAVWVVQWPRKGWFQVFQMQLKQKHHCRVEKFSPSKDIHPHIHDLAQMFMPPQIELDVEHIKAVRITSPSKVVQ